MATYKEYSWKVWAKCEESLPSRIKFYAQNVCQMRKLRIEVRADIVARADAREAAKLAADDWRHETVDIVDDSNDKADVDSANIDLAEFGVHTETSLADSVRKTRRRWAIEDYTNSSKIDVITTLTTKLKAEISTNKEDFIPIRRCQVAEIDSPGKGDINNISEDIVASFKR